VKITFEGPDYQDVLQQVLTFVMQAGTKVEDTQVEDTQAEKPEADKKPAAKKPAAKTTDNKKADLKVVKNTGKKISYDVCFTALKAFSKENGRAKAIEVLAKYDVSRLSELKDFNDIYQDLSNG